MVLFSAGKNKREVSGGEGGEEQAREIRGSGRTMRETRSGVTEEAKRSPD